MWSPADAVRRKLASLLQPWLREEPHLEVCLGFFRSEVRASDVLLDASVLNRLVESSSGGLFLFQRARVGRIVVGFSPWSAPAFAVSVDGVDVELRPRDVWRERRKDADFHLRERNRVLDSIDPQGALLKEIVADVLAMSLSKDCFLYSSKNVIMEHFQLQVKDIYVNMQLPTPAGEFSSFIKVREVCVGDLSVKPSNLFVGIIGAIIAPRREGSFKLMCSCFEIGLKEADSIKVLASSNYFWVSTLMWNLQFIDVQLHILNVELALSMGNIFDLIMAYKVIFSEEIKGARHGQELWKLAISRMSSLTSARFSLYKLVDAVLVWMHYVEAYKDLLCVLGYFSDESLKENLAKINYQTKCCYCVKQLYDKACELEEQLPVEAVAQARKVARSEGDSSHYQAWQSEYCPGLPSWGDLLVYLIYILRIVCYAVPWFLHFLYSLCVGIFKRNFAIIKLSYLFSVASSSPQIKRVFSLNCKEVSIKFHVTPAAIDACSKDSMENKFMNYCVYSFVIRSLCLSCVKDFSLKSFLIACGNAGASFSTSSKSPFLDENSETWKGTSTPDGDKRFLWVESAPQFSLPKKPLNPADYAGRLHHIILENHIGSMWLDWKKCSMRFAENEMQLLELPFLLCEVKKLLVDPCCQRSNHGMSNINLAIGKLNITVDHLLLVFINQLFDQIQIARSLSGSKIEKGGTCSSGQEDLLGNTNWVSRLNLLDSDLKTLINHLFPEQNVQLGLVIACPVIRLPLRCATMLNSNSGVTEEYEFCHFVFNFGKIEAVVWPSLPSVLSSLTGLNEADIGFLQFEKTQLTDNNEQHHTGSFCLKCSIELDACLSLDGASAFWEDLQQKKEYPVMHPISFKFQFSTRRVFFYSFQSISSSAMTLNGWMSGVSILLFMNELDALFQTFSCLLSLISSFPGKHGHSLTTGCPVFASNGIVFNNKDSDDTRFWFSAMRWFAISASLEVKSVTILLDKHRKVHLSGIHSTNTLFQEKEYIDGRLPSILNLVKYGVGISFHQISFQTIHEEGLIQVETKCHGLDSSIFSLSDATMRCIHESDFEKLLLYPVCSLYEFSVSDFTFNICASYGSSLNMENFGSIISHGKPEIKSDSSVQNQNLASVVSDNLEGASGPMIVMRSHLGVLFMSECSIKKVLREALDPRMMQALLTSVGGELQAISCEIQGGLLVLEVEALAMFTRYLNAYFLYVACLFQHLSEKMHYETAQSTLSNHVSSQNIWSLVQSIKFHQQDFGVVFAMADRSGGVWELMSELGFLLTINREDITTKILFQFSHLMIISQHLQPITLEQLEGSSSLQYLSCEANKTTDSQVPIEGSSSSRNPMRSRSLNLKNQILKDGIVSFNVEKTIEQFTEGLVTLWVGSGSISGLHLNITLADIQMLLILIESLPTLGQEKDADLRAGQKHGLVNVVQNHEFGMLVPDGAVIAIKDLQQHLYLAVEDVDSQYRVVGTSHYSLVGENALFRIRYHNQGRWGSRRLLFSLMSLSVKNGKGEPLCLSFGRGSPFVNVSCTDEKGSLWSINSYKMGNDIHGRDIDLNMNSSGRMVSLLNERGNCSVAFIDGFLTFVKGPGSPFKIKIFDKFTSTQENLKREASIASTRNEGANGCVGRTPKIVVSVHDISLTICHEFIGADEMFPLVKCCINNSHLIMQLMSSKMRFISKLSAAISYFDGRKTIWREILLPFNICIFYYHKFTDIVIGLQASSHMYIGVDKAEIYVNELSLDIVLFLLGELNLAGPFAVKQPMIFANCCQVKNQTHLSLICHFNNSKDVLLAGKQSGTVFLRYSTPSDHPREQRISMTMQLSAKGDFETSPVHFSIPESYLLAFRTRITSLKGSCVMNENASILIIVGLWQYLTSLVVNAQADSSAFPGPLIVIDISEKKQDGLSIVVSPMLKIHNESGFSMLLSFRRPQNPTDESASVILSNGDSIDDTLAVFDSLNFSGGLKKALMSLTLGNFILSLKPVIDQSEHFGRPVSIDWSNDLMGGKQVPLHGILDKLNFRIKRSFGACAFRSSFSTTCCFVCVEGKPVTSLHFLIRTNKREVPVGQAPNAADSSSSKAKPVALYEQKEIFLYPTVKITNHLQSEVLVLLSERDPGVSMEEDLFHIGKQAVIPAGSSTYFYANPSIIYITMTLVAFNLRSQPVNSREWIKKLNKQKHDVRCLDIELSFVGGKCVAFLQLSRGDTGILEVIIYTRYMLQNGTDHSLLVMPSHKLLSWKDVSDGCSIPPEHGYILTPKSSNSWFLKSNKIWLKVMKEGASNTFLDMDSISGLTEVSLKFQEKEVDHVQMLGVSASLPKEMTSSQLISFVPRYVIFNASDEDIILQHSFLGGDAVDAITVKSHHKSSISIVCDACKRREINLFDSFLKKHKNPIEDSQTYVRFCWKEPGWSCSGPVCIASLGKFFLKFKRFSEPLLNSKVEEDGNCIRYASVNIVEDGSSLVMNFHLISNDDLPYQIENCLSNASIMYYQKDSEEVDTLEAGGKSGYVWSNLRLPRKLIVQVNGMNEVQLTREINIDKVTSWKPLGKSRKYLSAPFISMENKSRNLGKNHHQSPTLEMVNAGYEIFTHGSTRVLRISEYTFSRKEDKLAHLHLRVQMRLPSFSMHLFDNAENPEAGESSASEQLLVARLGGISLGSVVSHECVSTQMQIKTLKVENKWNGAPFSAMIRRHQLDDDPNDSVLFILVNLESSNLDVKQVDHFSILLQPIDLNLDEETLMRLVTFWRTSLADPNLPSRRFYFKSFEIQPVKIVASFLPAPVNKKSNYDSAQEALRSLLHSVIKVPVVKNMVVELNGILLTHALVTTRELAFKCAQHYSWYAMRSIYVAKGSTLLPPAFASVFDDTASASLDMFFDPSSGLVNLPGLSLGMFKFVRKCIDSKGLSGTKRYLGDLSKTLRTAGSNVMFAAITAISDSVVKGAEINGVEGMVNGFHQGMLKLAMEPSFIGLAVMEGGPNRIIKLDKSPGVDEMYVQGYLQAMLDSKYNQAYLRVRVIDDQVTLKNLPPNNSIINEIMDNVKIVLVSKGLLQGEASTSLTRLHYLPRENEFRIGPTILTLCEHLFVSFSIRVLRKRTSEVLSHFQRRGKSELSEEGKLALPLPRVTGIFTGKWGITKFVLSGILAYIDGRLCRCIPNAVARRIVSGFLLSFLDTDNDQ